MQRTVGARGAGAALAPAWEVPEVWAALLKRPAKGGGDGDVPSPPAPLPQAHVVCNEVLLLHLPLLAAVQVLGDGSCPLPVGQRQGALGRGDAALGATSRCAGLPGPAAPTWGCRWLPGHGGTRCSPPVLPAWASAPAEGARRGTPLGSGQGGGGGTVCPGEVGKGSPWGEHPPALTHRAVPAAGPQLGSRTQGPVPRAAARSRGPGRSLRSRRETVQEKEKALTGPGSRSVAVAPRSSRRRREGGTRCATTENPRASRPLLPQVPGRLWQGRASATAAGRFQVPPRDDPPTPTPTHPPPAAHPTALPEGAARWGDIPHPNHSWLASPLLRQPHWEPRGTDKPPPTQPRPPLQGSPRVGWAQGAGAALGPSTTHSQACLLPGVSR